MLFKPNTIPNRIGSIVTSSSPPLASSWSWPSMRQSRLSCKDFSWEFEVKKHLSFRIWDKKQIVLQRFQNLRQKKQTIILFSRVHEEIVYCHSGFCFWILLFRLFSCSCSGQCGRGRLSWEYETSAAPGPTWEEEDKGGCERGGGKGWREKRGGGGGGDRKSLQRRSGASGFFVVYNRAPRFYLILRPTEDKEHLKVCSYCEEISKNM